MSTDRAISMAEFNDDDDDANPFTAMLAKMAGKGKPRPPVDEMAKMLTERCASLFVVHDFRPGQLLRFKRGLEWGQLEVAVFIRSDDRAAHLAEIGLIDGDGDFKIIGVDRRRLEPWE